MRNEWELDASISKFAYEKLSVNKPGMRNINSLGIVFRVLLS